VRLVKVALAGLIVVSLSTLWSSRRQVSDAYGTTPNTLQLRLGGVDLAVAKTDLSPSPYAPPVAPDTRDRPMPTRSLETVAEPVSPVVTAGGWGRISGTVVGPDGPVLQALIRLERHTTDGVGVLQGPVQPDGTWSFNDLPGGLYRARAWVPGVMTTGRSEVVFLSEGGVAEFAFSMWGIDPSPMLEFVDPGPIYHRGTGTVAVVLVRRSIDADGIVVTTPIPSAAVTIELASPLMLASSPVQFTDPQGAARFVLTCPASGVTDPAQAGVLVARSGEQVATFALPGCKPEPPPDEQDPASEGGAADA
jgi:hypothetical protein